MHNFTLRNVEGHLPILSPLEQYIQVVLQLARILFTDYLLENLCIISKLIIKLLMSSSKSFIYILRTTMGRVLILRDTADYLDHSDTFPSR